MIMTVLTPCVCALKRTNDSAAIWRARHALRGSDAPPRRLPLRWTARRRGAGAPSRRHRAGRTRTRLRDRACRRDDQWKVPGQGPSRRRQA
jgi:hypothetical protein